MNKVQIRFYVHRLVYETFIGKIPDGLEIDHINTIKTDYRLENLRLVTHRENMNNSLTKKHNSKAKKGRILTEEQKKKISESHKGLPLSDFGKKFKEYCERNNVVLNYSTEYSRYRRHNKVCRWEE